LEKQDLSCLFKLSFLKIQAQKALILDVNLIMRPRLECSQAEQKDLVSSKSPKKKRAISETLRRIEEILDITLHKLTLVSGRINLIDFQI